jgi:hypothetical protein
MVMVMVMEEFVHGLSAAHVVQSSGTKQLYGAPDMPFVTIPLPLGGQTLWGIFLGHRF